MTEAFAQWKLLNNKLLSVWKDLTSGVAMAAGLLATHKKDPTCKVFTSKITKQTTKTKPFTLCNPGADSGRYRANCAPWGNTWTGQHCWWSPILFTLGPPWFYHTWKLQNYCILNGTQTVRHIHKAGPRDSAKMQKELGQEHSLASVLCALPCLQNKTKVR